MSVLILLFVSLGLVLHVETSWTIIDVVITRILRWLSSVSRIWGVQMIVLIYWWCTIVLRRWWPHIVRWVVRMNRHEGVLLLIWVCLHQKY